MSVDASTVEGEACETSEIEILRYRRCDVILSHDNACEKVD